MNYRNRRLLNPLEDDGLTVDDIIIISQTELAMIFVTLPIPHMPYKSSQYMCVRTDIL